MNSILQRAKDVWKPNFFYRFALSEKGSHKTTWLFWIITGVIAAFIWAAVVGFFVSTGIPKVISGFDMAVPDGARITLQDGKLTIEGVEQPYIIEDESGGGIFIIDTQSDIYSRDDLADYSAAVLISQDGVYQKEDEVRSREFSYAKVENFSYSKEHLLTTLRDVSNVVIIAATVGVFLAMTLNLLVLRLLGALWWALIFMLVALIFGVKEKFSVFYFAVLNLYFIPLVIGGIMIAFGGVIPFFTTLIFIILFLLNLLRWKKEKDVQALPIAPENDKERIVPGTVLPAE